MKVRQRAKGSKKSTKPIIILVVAYGLSSLKIYNANATAQYYQAKIG
jgi:hypothetical protein